MAKTDWKDEQKSKRTVQTAASERTQNMKELTKAAQSGHTSRVNKVMEESQNAWKSTMNTEKKDPFAKKDVEEGYKFKGLEGNRLYTEKDALNWTDAGRKKDSSATSGKASAGYSKNHNAKTVATEGNGRWSNPLNRRPNGTEHNPPGPLPGGPGNNPPGGPPGGPGNNPPGGPPDGPRYTPPGAPPNDGSKATTGPTESNNAKASVTDGIENVGSYNTVKVDPSNIAKVIVQTVDNQYKDSYTKQGYQQMKHIGTLYGFGSVSRAVSKTDLEDLLYNRDTAYIKQSMADMGIKYYVNDSRTGNVVSDYQHNLRTIERQLSDRNINAQNLNLLEIGQALKTGKLTHAYNPGGGITLDANTKALLTELQTLKRMEHRVRQYQGAEGGLKNTAKAWVREGVQDSDVYQGYTFAKKLKTTTEVGLKAGKAGTGAVAKAGVNTIVGSEKLALRAKMLSNKVRLSDEAAATANAALSNKINVLTRQADKAKIGITNTLNPKLGVKAKNAVSSAGNKVLNKVFPRFRPLQNRIAGSKILKVIRKPFSIINYIKGIIKKYVLLALGWGFLIIAAILLIVTLIQSIFPSSVDHKTGETVEDSTAQKMINFIYSYQEAYTENLFQAKADSIYAEKSIPETWKEQVVNADATIAEAANNASVYDGEDNFIGFNFNKYWGQRAWTTGNGEDAVGLRPIYTTAVTGSWKVGKDEHGNDINQDHTVTLNFYGNAGLSGNIGDYSLSEGKTDGGTAGYTSIKQCWEDGVDVLNFDIKGGEENPGTYSEAYVEWAEKFNTDVSCTFNYRGSRYTFTVTPDKYSAYYDRGGHALHDYTIEELYRGFLTVAMGFTNNSLENTDFYTLYCKEIFDAVIDRADVTLHYEYEPEVVIDNLELNLSTEDGDVDLTCNSYYKCNVKCNVIIKDTGLPDLMYVDSFLEAEEPDGILWTHNEELGNTWAHSTHMFKDIEYHSYGTITGVGSTTVYSQWNEDAPDYTMWYTQYQGENQNPLWGMGIGEKTGESDFVYRHYNADGLDRVYTQVMEDCIEYYDFTVKDWENLIEGLTFPSGWDNRLSDGEIYELLLLAQNSDLNPSDFADYGEYLNYVLSTIGKYKYSFGAGHGTLDYRTYQGLSIDCSGYISMLMQAAGKLPTGVSLSTVGLRNYFGSTTYNGDTSSLSVGDLVFKTGNGSDAESNRYDHVAMFIGYIQLEGDTSPQPYFVESTSSKGSIISPASRFSDYRYVSHTG